MNLALSTGNARTVRHNGCDQAGAYAIVRNPEHRILIVQANSGRHYLPGGRIEPFETEEEALIREIREECGWTAEVRGRLGEAVQPIFDARISLHVTYWAAGLVAQAHDRPEHRMFWMPEGEALSLLHRQSDVALLKSLSS